jgi:Domain of unknown function (DUF4041)/T5orf172 domain
MPREVQIALVIAVLVVACVSLACLLWTERAARRKSDREKEEMRARLQAVGDVDEAIAKRLTLLEKTKEQAAHGEARVQAQLMQTREEAQAETGRLEAALKRLREEHAFYLAEQTVLDAGLYTPAYAFDISQRYKDELAKVREAQKVQIKAEQAVVADGAMSINGSASEGKKLTGQIGKLMLRAFNGEAEALCAEVRWDNAERMIDRLEKAFDAINRLASRQMLRISRDFFALKLAELRLTHEWQEKLQAEREEQRRLREQMREEERVRREAEKAQREAEQEEERYALALARAKADLVDAHGAEAEKMQAKIEQLEARLAEAQTLKQRAISMAQLTKTGNVYIISNVGSFGEGRFKIGMTRRQDPMERIRELGDASVPFEFDVHAMIATEDAPKLEGILHERFASRRVNWVNERKEFFDVTIAEIAAVVAEYDEEITVVGQSPAKEYRQTLAMKRTGAAAEGK